MTVEEEYEIVLEEAEKRFRDYSRGAKGQTFTVYDCLDFWVFYVTKEKYNETDKCESSSS